MFKYYSIATLIAVVAVFIWLKTPVTITQSNLDTVSSYPNQIDEVTITDERYETSNELPELLKTSSLKGTLIDGMYPVDEDGNLLLSNSIKHRFEYFLSVMGEFSLDEVKAMIRDDIELNLQEPARSQALQLFEDYVGYKYALTELEQSLQAPEDYEINDIERMRFQLQQLRDKRREYFNQETVDAFFGFDEMYDDFMLNRLEIQANTQLTLEEKEAQINSLEQNLPEDVRKMRDDTQRVSQVFEQTNNMRNEGVSEDEIFEINSQEFGQEAAERLQQLDRSRRAFQQKADNYLNKRKAILSDELLSDLEKEQKINEVLSSFDEDEQRRLKVFELMEREKSPAEN